jgi:hypothetical protein
MTRVFPVTAAVAAGIGIFLLASVVFADPVNPSFETSNLQGWESDDAGSGSVEVVTECEDCDTPFSPYEPQSGNYFALLVAGDEDEFASVTQTFQVRAGSVVSGWYFFCNNEEDGEDAAECSSGEGGPQLGSLRSAAVPDAEFCDELRIAYKVDEGPANEAVGLNACEHVTTDWTEFEVVVPGRGCALVDFELFAGVSNFGDSAVPSAMGLDSILVDDSICDTPTPTPTQRPNIGAGLSGLFAGQPTPLPTAPSAVAPAATAPTISPPRTGDAGLADKSNAPLYGVVAAGFVFAMLSAHRLVRR